MIYIFDTNSLSILFKNYYRERFPSLWEKFDEIIFQKRIYSVREVYNEIARIENDLLDWANKNKSLFTIPTNEEMIFVKEIFQIKHFQMMIRKQERLYGNPVADPFVIAKAKIIEGCVVSNEKYSNNAAKIPNICKHFKIDCINLQGFMEKESWTF